VKRPVQLALILCTAVWCLAIFLAPLFHLAPVYLFFSRVCHQLPTRSWHLYGEQLGLCIRCTSLSLGFFGGLLLLRVPNVRWLKISIAITAMQWLLAVTVMDSEALRVLSGLLLGATAAPVIRTGVEEMFSRVRTVHESM
jgi:uncharacterized membrane protein